METPNEETLSEETSVGVPRRRRRRWVFRLVAIGLSLVASLAAAEGVVRAFGLAPELPEQYRDFVTDPYLPYAPKPHTVRKGVSAGNEYKYEYRHNSRGLRDVEHELKKPDGAFRVLALGDSFTYGIGADFDDTYLVRAERLLNEHAHAGKRIEIIKAGVPRYFTEIQRLQLEHYGLQYEPDVVIVGFTSNDVGDAMRGLDALMPTDEEGYLISKRGAQLGEVGKWLYVHSHLARMVLAATMRPDEDEQDTEGETQTAGQLGREAAWRKIAEELSRMDDLCRAHGARFAVVFIPRGGLDSERKYADRLKHITDERKLALIDLLPYMRAMRSEHPDLLLYWLRDHHCTPLGYAVLADGLTRELVQRGLVP